MDVCVAMMLTRPKPGSPRQGHWFMFKARPRPGTGPTRPRPLSYVQGQGLDPRGMATYLCSRPGTGPTRPRPLSYVQCQAKAWTPKAKVTQLCSRPGQGQDLDPQDQGHTLSRLNQLTCFLGPTRVHTPNGISISSAVFARLKIVIEWPTNRQMLLGLW